MRILITNPEVDIFTRYLRVWTKKLIKNINKNNTIIHLDKNKAKRDRFTKSLEKKNIDLVFLNGHGSECFILGQDENIPILDENNAKTLKDKIIHAMSCNSLAKLGKIAVKNGANAYIGYDEPFFAPTFNEKNNDPLKDDTAALFLNPAFIVSKALANGKSPEEAVELAKKEYNRSIIKALTSGVQSDNDQFVGLLKWNRDHLGFAKKN